MANVSKNQFWWLAVLSFLLNWMPVQLFSQSGSPYPEDLSIPGLQQRELASFAGGWSVEVTMGSGQYAKSYSGSAKAEMIVGGRFLQLSIDAGSDADSLIAGFIVGYDRRNAEYQVTGMDGWGTYFVTASGKRIANSDSVKVYGRDNDPLMAKMGYEKEFGYLLVFDSPDMFSLDVILVDNRTAERKELNFIRYRFSRISNK